MAGPSVALVNRSTIDWGVTPEALAPALQRFVDEHLLGVWGATCAVAVTPELRPGSWGLVLLDHPDQAEALGYHELTPDGLPLAKVFVQTTLGDGERVSVTASHELAEMLLDPGTDRTTQTRDGTVYAVEICDAVQGSEFAVDGIPMASFVYPAWFQEGWQPWTTRLDHLGTLGVPFSILPHGYMPIYRDGGWSRLFGSTATAETFRGRDLRGRRHDRRGRPHRRSTPR